MLVVDIVFKVLSLVYLGGMFYVCLYSIMQLYLFVVFFARKKKEDFFVSCQKKRDVNKLPVVTIQLPVYNEKYVVERLLESVMHLNFPQSLLEVQILDDSNDDTVAIIDKKCKELSDAGINVKVIRRNNRVGFKAGALKEGLTSARGEFIAIFDADFVIDPDFLSHTLPYFDDEKVGVVQCRWGHINQKYSLLTEMQAFQLNVHFTIEQAGRMNGEHFLQFNGTAGIWRKSSIDHAGGWHADTLTEDLDLSIRAQLNGWKIKFLLEEIAPAELPVEMNGLRSQQFRWMKGGAENAKKLLPSIWNSDLGFFQKILNSVYLLSSTVFLAVFTLSVVSIPMFFFESELQTANKVHSVFFIPMLIFMVIYFTANVHIAWPGNNYFKKVIKFLLLFPIFLSLSMGLSFHNSIAVLEGMIGKSSDFVRTPKYGIRSNGEKFNTKKYFNRKYDWKFVIELLLGLVFLVCFVYGVYISKSDYLLLHGSLALGYLMVVGYTLKHSFSNPYLN